MSQQLNDKANVLLIGPPNVGKSVIFNHLTGLNINIANYIGTTVEFTMGEVVLEDTSVHLIDVPGTYTLEAHNQAEEVAVDMLRGRARTRNAPSCHNEDGLGQTSAPQKPVAVICVLDAFNLESSLYLLFQVLQYKIPTIGVINRVDLIQERGEEIEADALSKVLGIPIIPTVAVRKKGTEVIKTHLNVLVQARTQFQEQKEAETGEEWLPREQFVPEPTKAKGLWHLAEDLTARVKHKSKKAYKTKRQVWGERLVKPWPGIPLAVVILGLVFGIVVGIGMGIRQFLLLPLFRGLIIPAVVYGAEVLVPEGLLLEVLTGEYGLLVKGLEWPFTLVLPYVISFYSALSVLEDSGYLPRLGGLLDGILNKLGLPGSSVVPLLLGYGCGIPAIMATRSLNSYKERLTVSTLVSLGIPCVAQSGAFIALLAERSLASLLLVFVFSWVVIFLAGVAMDKILVGKRPYTIMEIPELLVPRGEVVLKKVWLQLKNYITDGAIPMIIIIGIAAFFYEIGVMGFIGQILTPLVVTWLHLPAEASTPLILGVFRRELTVIPLLEMDLSTLQLFTGAIVGLLYVPCVAIIASLAKEFNLKMALFVLVLTSMLAFLMGGLIARLGGLLF